MQVTAGRAATLLSLAACHHAATGSVSPSRALDSLREMLVAPGGAAQHGHGSMLASSYMHEVLCPNNCGLCDFWAI